MVSGKVSGKQSVEARGGPGRSILGLACSVLAGSVLALPGPGHAQSASLQGSWRGSGHVTFASGDKERVTCRATYSRLSGDTFSLTATCASPSGSITQSATVVRSSGNTYRGDIYNVEYNSYGSIVVEVSGNTQRVTLRGQAGSGYFTLSRR